MKDRMARAVIERAAGDGRLSPGGTVVGIHGRNDGHLACSRVCGAWIPGTV